MFDSKRKYKRILTVGILAVLIVMGIARLNIQSVDEYQKEQKQLAEELLVSETPEKSEMPEQSQVPPIGEIGSAEPSILPSVSPSGNRKKKMEKELPSPSAERKDTTAKQNNKTVVSDTKKQKTEKSKKPEKKSGTHKNKSNTTKPSAIHSPKNPLPSGTPVKEDESDAILCKVAIRCDSLLDHMSEVDPSMKKYIPSDGKLLPVTTLKAKQGDTAYTILQKVCKAKNIALDAEYSSTFSTEYVRGIGHLYEKKAGAMSGWLYLVNGKLVNQGASSYQLQKDDFVEWVYTCTGRLE